MTEAERRKLVIDNMSLVGAIAKHYSDRGVDFEDLMAIGQEGLVLAARDYCDRSSYSFSKYASQRINRHLQDELKSGRHHLWGEEEAPPCDEDAGSSEHIERIYEYSTYPWLIGEPWPSQFNASPEAMHLMFDEIQEKQELFLQAFETLRPRHQTLVRLVYLRDPPMELDRVARELKVSYLQASRMLEHSLRLMREHIIELKSNNGRRVVDLTC